MSMQSSVYVLLLPRISDSWLCIFAVELATTHLALLVVHVEENGLNLSVELMVLLTSLLATLAARTHSETQLVACFSSGQTEIW